MYVHNFTLQNPIRFEIDPPKKRGAGGKNVRVKNVKKKAKAHVGIKWKGILKTI